MSSAATLLPDARTVSLGDGRYRFLNVMAHSAIATEIPPPQRVSHYCISSPYQGTADPHSVTLIQYGDDSETLIVFDFGEPLDEFPKEDREAVEHLRRSGRSVLADRVEEMLRDAEEDPDAPAVNLVSLRDMARILTEHGDFTNPVVSLDRRGLVHGQWRIDGNGFLVVSFLGHDEVVLIAQADECPSSEALDISDRGPARDILGRHGHLVPCQ